MLPLRFPNSGIRAKAVRKGGGWPWPGTLQGGGPRPGALQGRLAAVKAPVGATARGLTCYQATGAVPTHGKPARGGADRTPVGLSPNHLSIS
ncbi:hypothetical protein B296_00018710 [Ensete ventricosum]|uniref:Uncharacterized protein n=1 Tax=Ensete ventricosum TaxID=4639 RepID=A0A426ZQI9_ENSVE|nr:hypothetical protein B296_00018710 [Ensete ventricosum]